MVQIGPVVIDFNPLIEAAARSPWHGMWYLVIHGGWVIFVLTFLIGFKWIWLLHINRKFQSKWKWVLLSIEVPAENIQSPRAVENILAHLAGAHMTYDLIEKYFTGFAQEFFSLEVVSRGGLVHFYIYTPVHLRDLVAASIYAQYPTAEITEAEDYVKGMPDHFPDPEWALWGTEWKLVRHQAYPIRTYEEFQDETAEEAAFKDPMAALLETMSSLLPEEQLWLQIIITPIKSNSWQSASYRLVDKLAGIPSEGKQTWFEKLMSIPGMLVTAVVDAMLPGTPAHDARAKEDLPSKMLYLTPGEREVIEAIERKAAKIGFHTKIRGIYLSKKATTNKARGRFGIIGAIKQINTEDLNSLKPDTKKIGTHAHYLFIEWRKNWKRRKIMRAYKVRSNWRGHVGYVLNIEEIATLWHFPISESVKTPLLVKSESKRAEPPHELPTEVRRSHGAPAGTAKEEAPEDLPVG